jgi:hypothetical protein
MRARVARDTALGDAALHQARPGAPGFARSGSILPAGKNATKCLIGRSDRGRLKQLKMNNC